MTVSNRTITFNVIGLLFVKAISMLASLSLIPVLLDYFRGDESLLGTWLVFAAFVAIATSFDLGIGNRLKNDILTRVSNKSNYADLIRESLLAQAIIAFAIVLLILAGNLIVSNIYVGEYGNISITQAHPELVTIASILILFSMPLRLSYFILQAQQRNAFSAFIALVPQLAVLAYVVVIGIHHSIASLTALSIVLLIATIAAYLIPLAVIVFARNIKQMTTPWKTTLKLVLNSQIGKVKSGLAFFVVQIAIIFLYSYNEIFYLAIGTTTDIVHYQYYFRPFSLFAVGFSIVSLPFWSAIRLSHLGNNNNRTRKLSIAIVLLNIPVTIAIISTAYFFQTLLDFWLGSGTFTATASMLTIFACFSILVCLMHAFSSILSGYDLISFQAKTLTAGLVFKFASFSFLHSIEIEADPVMMSTVIGLFVVVAIFAYKSIELWKTDLMVRKACL